MAKVFEDPRLVFTGLPNDGVSIKAFAKIWADHDFRLVTTRTIAKILRRQEGMKAYAGEYVKGNCVAGGGMTKMRGVRGWRFEEK